jgi:DNA polymerase-3 subunit alpha
LKPTVFDDLIAMNALYRPGPMQWIGDFIDRKHGKTKIDYLHKKTEGALKNTYGVLVYQEQVMQIAKDLCGFTGGQADTLRKGVAKKRPEVLAALKKDFIEGALKNSDISRAKIEEFWVSLEAFAAYCFPKSHSSCYATIAYQTAYLKANYPAAFMAALMTSDYDDIDRLAIEINECKHMGITVLPPDVQESFLEFAVIKDKEGNDQIRFGMRAIKNVGAGAVEEILRARQIDGGFSSLEDFLSKTSVRVVNRKALESLAKSGALDGFGDRSVLVHNIDTLIAYANRVQKESNTGQTDLFGALEDNTHIAPKLALSEVSDSIDNRTLLSWERELLGLYLSQHPLQEFEAILSEQCIPIGEIKSDMDGKTVEVGGSVVEIKEVTTKTGQKMAFATLADLSKEIELVLFPNAYQKTLGMWERDEVVLVKGKISSTDRNGNTNEEVKILVDDARPITEAQAKAYEPVGKKPKAPKATIKKSTTQDVATAVEKRLYIRLLNTDDHEKLTRLKRLIDARTGNTPIVLVVGEDSNKKVIKLPTAVEPNDAFFMQLSEIFGEAAVKYQ